MAIRPLPDQATLLKLLRYDGESGTLYWRARPALMFEGTKRFRAEVKAQQWNSRYAGKPALNAKTDSGYRRGMLLGVQIYAHRVVWCINFGAWPVAQIDHISGDRADNRLLNLREATRSDNLKNAKVPSTNTSGHLGVYFMAESGKWRARLGHRKTKVELGSYSSFDAACEARERGNRKYGFHPNHGRSK